MSRRAIESFGLDRLEQVVEGIDAKRLDGIPVVRSCEDDRHVAVETLEQLEARQTGHLDVQEQHVDRVHLKEGERRDRIGFRAHDVDSAGRREQPRQPLDGEPFIVDEVCAHVQSLSMVRLRADTTEIVRLKPDTTEKGPAKAGRYRKGSG